MEAPYNKITRTTLLCLLLMPATPGLAFVSFAGAESNRAVPAVSAMSGTSAMSAIAMSAVKVPLILQSNAQNCGLASLAMLLSHFRSRAVSVPELQQTSALLLRGGNAKPTGGGYSVGELQKLAEAYGVALHAERVELKTLADLTFPAIAWLNLGANGHFTVVQSWQKNEASLADPTRGYLTLGRTAWKRLWLTGDRGIVLFADDRL